MTMTDSTDSTDSTDTPEGGTPEPEQIRTERFAAEEPVSLDITVATGRLTVQLRDEPGVEVEVRDDPAAAGPWPAPLFELLGWVGQQFNLPVGPETSDEAIDQTRIDFTLGRLVVRTPGGLTAKSAPLAVTVRAPAGSRVQVRTGSARTRITGTAGRINVASGGGDITVDGSDGDVEIVTGSGAVTLGEVRGALKARSGTGSIEVAGVGGSANLFTGSGDVRLGAVQDNVVVRTGSGDLTVAEAVNGRIALVTGSGDIRIGVRAGCAALVDLASGSGRTHSELTFSRKPPEARATLRLYGRTRSGNAVVTTA
jgi:hypothetical protein